MDDGHVVGPSLRSHYMLVLLAGGEQVRRQLRMGLLSPTRSGEAR